MAPAIPVVVAVMVGCSLFARRKMARRQAETCPECLRIQRLYGPGNCCRWCERDLR